MRLTYRQALRGHAELYARDVYGTAVSVSGHSGTGPGSYMIVLEDGTELRTTEQVETELKRAQDRARPGTARERDR